MCYSEFNDIPADITAMDADEIPIETAPSQMELLEGFADSAYPAGIGPEVYDIHAPLVPEEAQMVRLIRLAGTRLDPAQLWIDSDCGQKTGKWDEVEPALKAMVGATQTLRVAHG